MDELKKLLLAGIGSIAYTYEKSAKVIEELVDKGRISVDEGKELSQELKRTFKDKSEEFNEKVMPLTKEDLKNILCEEDFVPRDEFNELREQVTKLESKLNSILNSLE